MSCIIFESTGLISKLTELMASYKRHLSVMLNKELEDEEKQKRMFSEIGQQVKLLAISTILILLIISPFLIYILADTLYFNIGYELLYSFTGLGISILTVLFYLAIKKAYVRLFGNRQDST